MLRTCFSLQVTAGSVSLHAQAFSPAAMSYRPPKHEKLKAKAVQLQALVCNATVPRTRDTELREQRASMSNLVHRAPSI